jgi:hypothetical protein
MLGLSLPRCSEVVRVRQLLYKVLIGFLATESQNESVPAYDIKDIIMEHLRTRG